MEGYDDTEETPPFVILKEHFLTHATTSANGTRGTTRQHEFFNYEATRWVSHLLGYESKASLRDEVVRMTTVGLRLRMLRILRTTATMNRIRARPIAFAFSASPHNFLAIPSTEWYYIRRLALTFFRSCHGQLKLSPGRNCQIKKSTCTSRR